jgi:hypothetical protein
LVPLPPDKAILPPETEEAWQQARAKALGLSLDAVL